MWRGDNNLRTLVSKDDRKFFCALLGIENTDAPPPTQGKKRPHEGESGASSTAAGDVKAEGGAGEGSAPKRAREDADVDGDGDNVDDDGDGGAAME